MKPELPVDLQRLGEIAGDDEAFIQELLETFVDSSLELLRALRAAVADRDPDALRREAHRLKGASANVGADELRDVALQLEQLGISGSTDGAAALVDRVSAELDRVRAYLATQIAK